MILSYRGAAPKTEQAAFIAPNATICGDVTLGEGVTVWFGAVLRTEIDPMVIGKGTNIQDNCVLHCDFGYPLRLATTSPWATARWSTAVRWATTSLWG